MGISPPNMISHHYTLHKRGRWFYFSYNPRTYYSRPIIRLVGTTTTDFKTKRKSEWSNEKKKFKLHKFILLNVFCLLCFCVVQLMQEINMKNTYNYCRDAISCYPKGVVVKRVAYWNAFSLNVPNDLHIYCWCYPHLTSKSLEHRKT